MSLPISLSTTNNNSLNHHCYMLDIPLLYPFFLFLNYLSVCCYIFVILVVFLSFLSVLCIYLWQSSVYSFICMSNYAIRLSFFHFHFFFYPFFHFVFFILSSTCSWRIQDRWKFWLAFDYYYFDCLIFLLNEMKWFLN